MRRSAVEREREAQRAEEDFLGAEGKGSHWVSDDLEARQQLRDARAAAGSGAQVTPAARVSRERSVVALAADRLVWGRFSFGGFNPTVEKLMVEHRNRSESRRVQDTAHGMEVSVSETLMADRVARKMNRQQQVRRHRRELEEGELDEKNRHRKKKRHVRPDGSL